MNVLIHGGGVAAGCCAHLLREAGIQVAIRGAAQPRVPAVVLGESALALLRDIFNQPGLFRDAPRVRNRVVAWGRGQEPVTIEHHAAVVSEQMLIESLGPHTFSDSPDSAEPDWTICTSRPLPPETEDLPFGSRLATITPVHLKTSTDACWIESFASGWLFLIPSATRSGWLISVGDTAFESRVISKIIETAGEPFRRVPAYPRISAPLSGKGWLACGSAAMTFDPLCGDGTAQAVREAILAAAVIRAGYDPHLLDHYQARLVSGFARHLSICREFYTSGHGGDWWTQETDALNRGLAWCAQMHARHPRFEYRLVDFDLQRC